MSSDAVINGDRLWRSIMASAQIGATAKGGLNRLALTDLDRQMRDLFVSWCEDAGLRVSVDGFGNITARREGANAEVAPISFGSHLDTQPNGGKFDGVLGVLAGLEVMRALSEARFSTHAPLELINWTNEEGSRFAPAMISSGGFAGVFDRDYVLSRADRDGKTLGDELKRIGYAGEAPIGRKLSAYFELHIEQGPILEAEDKVIGVVGGGQGAKWYELTISGNAGHAGATPMRLRRDALLGAARIVELVNKIAQDHGPDGVGTVGLLEVYPNSRNVVPEEIFFTVDLRHPQTKQLVSMDSALRRGVDEIASALSLGSEIKQIWDSPPVEFNTTCAGFIRAAAEEAGYRYREMISGAAHDAIYVSRVSPTAMIFIPCEKGLSHNEAENISFEHAVAGADVLLQSILRCDSHLARGGVL